MPISKSIANYSTSLILRNYRFRLLLKFIAIVLLFFVFGQVFWRNQDFIIFISKSSPKSTLSTINLNDSGAPPECYCQGELFCFKGVNKLGKLEYGQPFNCSLYKGLAENGLLLKDIQNTPAFYEKMDEHWDPIFVTSVAENHVAESRTLIKRIRTFYPTSKIVVFDIGLPVSAVEELTSICNVEVKPFNFTKYPPHVSTLKNYSFKLVILEALQLYNAFFYYDTSVLIQNSNIHASFLEAVKSGLLPPFSTHLYTYHSVFAATHPTMYKYMPVPPEAIQIEEGQASSMFVVDSPYTRRIMKWWFLCANTEECIAPKGSNIKCDVWKFKDRYKTYMDCHRYDQSFWNIYSIIELFGEERQAIRFKYIDHDFDYIDLELAQTVEKNRHRILNTFFKPLIKIKRGNPTRFPLKWPCPENDNELENLN